MNRKGQNEILGAIISMTYSLYPVEMTEQRNEIVHRALALMATDASTEQIEKIIFVRWIVKMKSVKRHEIYLMY